MLYPFPPPVIQAYWVYPFPQPAEWTCRGYPFPQPAVWTCRVSPLPPPASISTSSRMDVQDVTISRARSMDVYCAVCMPFHRQQYGHAQYGRAGCTPFLMPDCPVFSQSRTGMNKIADAGTRGTGVRDPVRYRNAPEPDWDTGCRNAYAGGIDLDADAQLWSRVQWISPCWR